MVGFTLLSAAVTLILLFQISQAALIDNFGNCPELNNYFVNFAVPLVGPYGLSSSNAYANSRNSPERAPKNAGKPGGPAGLRLRRPFADPKTIQFSNLTKPNGKGMNDDDENGLVPGEDFSTTNVQVEGVDEPDIIKTDGKRIFTLSGTIFSSIQVLDNGASGQRTGKLVLPTYPQEMLIEGDYVLAIGQDYSYKRPVYQRYVKDPSYGEAATVVYQIYVGGPVPRLISTLHLEGQYVKSREVDGVVRLVMRFDPLSSIYLYYPYGQVTAAQTEKWNREIIQYSKPENWLPTYTLKIKDRVQWGTYANCASIYHSTNVFSGFRLLTVVTLRISGRLTPGSSATVMSDAETVYATKSTMYVTTSEFHFTDVADSSARWGANYQTSVHKFGLSDVGATYIASGSVTGSVINQFALHEYLNTFFIATTDGANWWTNRDLSQSKLTAFSVNEKTRALQKIGEVGNLGVGERIYSVRYIADTAYVVTFRETDPLYIIDLSVPTNLRVTGELKIPGFSSYLHPVAPGRILGVGQEATSTGRTTGAKVSLFDVSNKSAPKEISTWSLLGSYTDAQWDHRAFLYWRLERVAVLPVNVYYYPQSFFGAIVLDISDSQITERGRIVHNIPGQTYTPSILRNAIVGGVYLWSMSSDILQVNNIRKLKKVVDQVSIT